MRGLLTIFFNDLRVTLILFLLIFVFLPVSFEVLDQFSDKFVQDEKTRESISNIESISINGLYLYLLVGGIGTTLAVLAWITGFFDSILDMIRI